MIRRILVGLGLGVAWFVFWTGFMGTAASMDAGAWTERGRLMQVVTDIMDLTGLVGAPVVFVIALLRPRPTGRR